MPIVRFLYWAMQKWGEHACMMLNWLLYYSPARDTICLLLYLLAEICHSTPSKNPLAKCTTKSIPGTCHGEVSFLKAPLLQSFIQSFWDWLHLFFFSCIPLNVVHWTAIDPRKDAWQRVFKDFGEKERNNGKPSRLSIFES